MKIMEQYLCIIGRKIDGDLYSNRDMQGYMNKTNFNRNQSVINSMNEDNVLETYFFWPFQGSSFAYFQTMRFKCSGNI